MRRKRGAGEESRRGGVRAAGSGGRLLCTGTWCRRPSVIYSVDAKKHFLLVCSNFLSPRRAIVRVEKSRTWRRCAQFRSFSLKQPNSAFLDLNKRRGNSADERGSRVIGRSIHAIGTSIRAVVYAMRIDCSVGRKTRLRQLVDVEALDAGFITIATCDPVGSTGAVVACPICQPCRKNSGRVSRTLVTFGS
jgi:hypothetical protein